MTRSAICQLSAKLTCPTMPLAHHWLTTEHGSGVVRMQGYLPGCRGGGGGFGWGQMERERARAWERGEGG